MTESELKKKAREYVLESKGIRLEPDKVMAETVSGEMTSDPTGKKIYRAKVIVRKHFVDMSVRLDADSGLLYGWLIPDRYDGATETILGKEEAMQIAIRAVPIPNDAKVEEFSQEKSTNSHITNISWQHIRDEREVEGDFVAVQINSRTGQIISLNRVWNQVDDFYERITSDDAVRVAREKAPDHGHGNDFDIELAGQKYIPVIVDETSSKKEARHIKVWVVNIVDREGKFPRMTTLNIDCRDGTIKRVEHSK
jgi:uncharacterized membrane protein YkoI